MEKKTPKEIRPRRAVAWLDEATTLRANPGEWFAVRTGAPNETMTYTIRNGVLRAFRPKGSYDAEWEWADDGTMTIFAKYVGDDEPMVR